MRHRDVELRCAGCGRETLATDGHWDPRCWVCGGLREVIRRHNHALSYAEMIARGFTIAPAGFVGGRKD